MTGLEQRRHRRLRCSGSAEVFLAATGTPCPARVVNLSRSGCLLILRSPQPLARDARVEIAFTVNQLPFRVLGEVKAVRSDREFGLYFPALSRRAEMRLEDLVEELAEMGRKGKGGIEVRGSLTLNSGLQASPVQEMKRA